MKTITAGDISDLYLPSRDSHKGQNGKLLIIGGSHLFHAASLWALEVASRIVDLVHYSSVAENNRLVAHLKQEFRNGIVVPRTAIEDYVQEDDCILIGPGMVRAAEAAIPNSKFQIPNLNSLDKIEDEGVQTAALTSYLLTKYPEKQWVIDAGALQMMNIQLIPKRAILTPHRGEFELIWEKFSALPPVKSAYTREIDLGDRIKLFANHFQCLVIVKGATDIICDGGVSDGRICEPGEILEISGGNPGMTKGGTGDVLAGLIAALACKNQPLSAVIAGSYINKKAGDELYKQVGPYFNASDLADEIPKIMHRLYTKTQA